MSHHLNEDTCPVPENVLGQLYRASPEGVATLIETVPSRLRAMLAVYCYRRVHLASIGVAIAATCSEEELLDEGGNTGADLFAKSRSAETVKAESFGSQRRKITLSSGPLRTVIAQDLV